MLLLNNAHLIIILFNVFEKTKYGCMVFHLQGRKHMLYFYGVLGVFLMFNCQQNVIRSGFKYVTLERYVYY